MRHCIEVISHLPVKELAKLLRAGWVLFRVRRTRQYRSAPPRSEDRRPMACSGCGRPVDHHPDEAADGVLHVITEAVQAIVGGTQ